jgi:pimeloyl-ACP methyl ester carboxylesterase
MAISSESVTFQDFGVVIVGERWAAPNSRGEVLLLHGGGQTRHAWGAGAARIAAAGWTCTTVDLRGHGDSGWAPDGAYDIGAYVNDIRVACAELGGNVIVVGASLGGITALTLAAETTSPIRALVLVDIAPRVEPEGIQRILEFMTGHVDGFASLDEVADAVAGYTGRARTRNLEGLKKNVRQHEDGHWYWHWDPAMMSPLTREEPRPGITGDALLAAAREVRVPVLLLRGGRSDVVSDDGVQELVDAVPDVVVVVVTGAGHMVAGDDNDMFVSSVADFLETRV